MIACSSILGLFGELFNRLCCLLPTSHFCIPTGCELSFQIYILNGARNVLFCVVIWVMVKSLCFWFWTIVTLLEILCLGAHISAKLLLCPNSGISNRFSGKLWFDHLSWTPGRCGHFDAVPPSRSRDLPEPWFRQVKLAEPGRGCSAGKSGKGFSSWSSRNWSLLTFRLRFEPA